MGKTNFTETAYKNLDDFVYGTALKPVKLKNGMEIGGGTLYPEVNFTLPTMLITEETFPEVINIYKEIATGISTRATELSVPGYVAEIELLPPTTFKPEWGIEICKVVVDIIKEREAKNGAKGAVRITPVDIREGRDLEHMWHGKQWDNILKTFEGSVAAGAELLSIESIGGKEVHDEGTMYADIKKVLFALGILGTRDMEKLWTEIVKIADSKDGVFAAGDTACGFANTSMVLADENYIPKVFAAVDRVLAAVRTMVAVECGAKGPDKDCGYEGVYLKAITGTPISMEGKTAACAHLSHVGNVALCLADMWSNESVQHIRLLGAMSEVVSTEMLAYDCRFMNMAKSKGKETALLMRDMLADTDSAMNPTAYILRPDIVLEIAKELVKAEGYYNRAKAACNLTIAALQKGYDGGKLCLNDKEVKSLEKMRKAMATLPADEGAFIEESIKNSKALDPAKYDM